MTVELRCQIPNPKDLSTKTYFLDGRKLSLEESQSVLKISNAFNHGYLDGQGPQQLALAICLELFDQAAALRLYKQFHEEHIATRPLDEPFSEKLDVTKYIELAKQ